MTEPLAPDYFKNSGINKADCKVLWQRCQSAAKRYFNSSDEIAKAMYHYIRNHRMDVVAKLEELDQAAMQAAYQQVAARFKLSTSPEKPEDRQKLFEFLESQSHSWLNPKLVSAPRQESILSLDVNSAVRPNKKDAMLAPKPNAPMVTIAPPVAIPPGIKAPLSPLRIGGSNSKNLELKQYVLWLSVRFALVDLTHADLVCWMDKKAIQEAVPKKLGLTTGDPKQELIGQYRAKTKFALDPLAAKHKIITFWGCAVSDLPEFRIDAALAEYLGLNTPVVNPSAWLSQQFANFCQAPQALTQVLDPRVVASGHRPR